MYSPEWDLNPNSTGILPLFLLQEGNCLIANWILTLICSKCDLSVISLQHLTFVILDVSFVFHHFNPFPSSL